MKNVANDATAAVVCLQLQNVSKNVKKSVEIMLSLRVLRIRLLSTANWVAHFTDVPNTKMVCTNLFSCILV